MIIDLEGISIENKGGGVEVK